MFQGHSRGSRIRTPLAIIILGTLAGVSSTTAKADPIIINSIQQLDEIGTDPSMPLSGNYALGGNIDAKNFNFSDIGSLANPFTGTFNGNGHTIGNLSINVNDPVAATANGMFSTIGSTGIVKNVGLVNLAITGGNGYSIGGLVGENDGTIQNANVTGTINVRSGGFAGALVGFNLGNVLSSNASATVQAGPVGGGLVGYNNGLISHSHATGTVTESYFISNGGDLYGGLSGYNSGSITQSYATGPVNATGNNFSRTGGLVGYNGGSVIQSYATGSVNGGSDSVL